jgi:ribosome biogenesis GTPase
METFSFPALGWNTFFEEQLASLETKNFSIGRISTENKTNYNVIGQTGEFVGEVTGKLAYTAESFSALPKVGDWVLFAEMNTNRVIIHHVFERQTTVSRKAAGRGVNEQIIATNLDVLFIVQSLDQNFNISRIERYLSALSGIEAVVVLNKSDCCEDPVLKADEVKNRLTRIKVITTSCATGDVDQLRSCIQPGKTFAFAGSSGVGKSSLINSIIEADRQKTMDTRQVDGKGKHTTTRREMIVTPGGGILIDTPGMREFEPWAAEGDMTSAFDDIELLAEQCRYADCSHVQEHYCAVKEAVNAGQLDEMHYQNYLKLKRELNYQQSLADPLFALERKKVNKKHQRALNRMIRKKPE